MPIRALLAIVLSATLAARAVAASDDPNYPLDFETMSNALRTRSPDEEAYLKYVAVLVSQGRLPRDIVLGTFQWARNKQYPKRVQYFRFGLNQRLGEIGIRMPAGTPSLTGTIQGEAYYKVLGLKLPAAGVTVKLDGTDRSVIADLAGRFEFEDVPIGTQKLVTGGLTLGVYRTGSAVVDLPSKPPSTTPVEVGIEVTPLE
ncbi:MAG: hypothetical protein ACOY3P_07220 [Planctomycetota bacterium]